MLNGLLYRNWSQCGTHTHTHTHTRTCCSLYPLRLYRSFSLLDFILLRCTHASTTHTHTITHSHRCGTVSDAINATKCTQTTQRQSSDAHWACNGLVWIVLDTRKYIRASDQRQSEREPKAETERTRASERERESKMLMCHLTAVTHMAEWPHSSRTAQMYRSSDDWRSNSFRLIHEHFSRTL